MRTPYVCRCSHSSTSTPEDVVPLVQVRHFQAMVGCLIYLEQGTRFDLAFAIAQLTRVMGAPNLSHMSCVKQVYRYIAGTRNLGITYGAPDSVVTQASLDGFNYPLSTYVDASLGSEHTKGKSPTGVIVCHFGSPIMWTSHLQSVVALSTMESEMMATSTAWYTTHLVREKCIC